MIIVSEPSAERCDESALVDPHWHVAASRPGNGSPGGLIFGLIRIRSSMFIGIRINAAMQVTAVSVIRRTIIPSPENRKVGGSILLWTYSRQLPVIAEKNSLTTHRGSSCSPGVTARSLHGKRYNPK